MSEIHAATENNAATPTNVEAPVHENPPITPNPVTPPTMQPTPIQKPEIKGPEITSPGPAISEAELAARPPVGIPESASEVAASTAEQATRAQITKLEQEAVIVQMTQPAQEAKIAQMTPQANDELPVEMYNQAEANLAGYLAQHINGKLFAGKPHAIIVGIDNNIDHTDRNKTKLSIEITGDAVKTKVSDVHKEAAAALEKHPLLGSIFALHKSLSMRQGDTKLLTLDMSLPTEQYIQLMQALAQSPVQKQPEVTLNKIETPVVQMGRAAEAEHQRSA